MLNLVSFSNQSSSYRSLAYLNLIMVLSFADVINQLGPAA